MVTSYQLGSKYTTHPSSLEATRSSNISLAHIIIYVDNEYWRASKSLIYGSFFNPPSPRTIWSSAAMHLSIVLELTEGAYMQDSLQIQALLERCRVRELREVQLGTERDTIKAMFECLASSIRSDLLQSDSTVIGPSSADSTHPTCQLYPRISFWTQDDYMEWLETASSRTTDHSKLPYLEDADGVPVPETTIKAICKLLRGGWSELLSRKMAPQSWGKIILQHRHILPGAGTTLTVTTITSLETASRKKKKKPMTTTTTTTTTLPNPLSVHSLTAANVDIPPSPQVTPDHPLETPGPIDPLLDDSASLIIKKEKMSKAGSKCKMRPSPTKNGCNLCAHRWLKQMNTTGSTDEFCIYYNSLSQGQRKEYDDEASKLIAEGNWNKTAIVAGKMY
ncbi:hypothetical protein BDR05DRAFT_948024 [Suillus weaverae]|nr:hypothetical protein BDR05DRAFT_948024 [Suillus weaverae]